MDTNLIVNFIIVFARITSFLFIVPFFKGSYIPMTAKVVVGMGISIYVVEMVPYQEIQNMYEFIALLVLNIGIGLIMAYFVDMLFQAIQMAGSMMDFDMGLSMAEVVDPSNGTRKTVIAGLYQTLFVIVFIMVGGIQTLIMNLVMTFKLTDPKGPLINGEFMELMMAMLTFMFSATFQLALPFMATIFIVNFVFLIVGRASPQMNIFANMFMVKIMLGMLFFILIMPFLSEMFISYTNVINEKMLEVIKVIYK